MIALTQHLPGNVAALAPDEPLRFDIVARAAGSAARAGVLQTPHGALQTPVFMPVGTHATVKAVAPDDLEALGASIVLANTYHLLLRPGPELVAHFGGLHGFMRWHRPISPTTAGFQALSLGRRAEGADDGVPFPPHLDGSEVNPTPERLMPGEGRLGA